MPEGMLLGVKLSVGYEQLCLQLRSEDTLLFYTDGLIERRAASISDALAEFAAAAVPADLDLGAHAARILATVSDTGDDAASSPPASANQAPGSVRRRLSTAPASPGSTSPKHQGR